MTPETELRAKWPPEARKEQEGVLSWSCSMEPDLSDFGLSDSRTEGTLGWFSEPSSLSSFVSAASGN